MTQFNETEDKLSVVFESRLDSFQCSKLDAELSEKLAEVQKPVEFDLSQVDFVASSFLRICLSSCQKVGPDKFSIVHINPNVKKVFKIAGLDSMVKMD